MRYSAQTREWRRPITRHPQNFNFKGLSETDGNTVIWWLFVIVLMLFSLYLLLLFSSYNACNICCKSVASVKLEIERMINFMQSQRLCCQALQSLGLQGKGQKFWLQAKAYVTAWSGNF